MTAKEVMEQLFHWSPCPEEKRTRDKLIYGNEMIEVKKVAVCQIATPQVLRQAAEAGAQMVLTHEPTYHDFFHLDETDPVYREKSELIQQLGMTIFRFHDSPHWTDIDKINAGFLNRLGWIGEFDGCKKFVLQEEKTIAEIQKDMEDKLDLHHVRFIGPGNKKVKTVSLCAGAWGEHYLFEQLNQPDIDLVICGEVCEWNLCEYVRDATELGMEKALLILGHMGSERSGMEYVAQYINDHIDGVEAISIDCGEVYQEMGEYDMGKKKIADPNDVFLYKTIGEGKRKEQVDYDFVSLHERANDELTLQQSKRDQIITLYLAVFSFLVPFALSLDIVTWQIKGTIFLAVALVGVLFSLAIIRYRVYKEIYWLSCQSITVLMNFKQEELDKETVQAVFYHSLHKKGHSFVKTLEDGGAKFRKWYYAWKSSFSAETMHFAVQALITSITFGLSVGLIIGTEILAWKITSGILAGFVVFAWLLWQYFSECIDVYKVLEDNRESSFNKTFSKAWFLHFYV